MQKVLVSACLLGERVRYDGSDCQQHGVLDQWQRQGRIVSLCPETMAGLPTPRPPAEIEGGDVGAVMRGQGAVRRQDGTDVTDAFVEGAEIALRECWHHKIKVAILKEGSPSCGVCLVNDGSFSGVKIEGQGMTARLLIRHGISVFSEHQLQEAEQRVRELEALVG
ncbi:DUF523 domain-containing protein [Mariprofundus ferrooxydans]|uniref:Uncharacterized protein n=1 Tax=Mariprofundus ferrooxydans PV-1 TaxID=314345 RepID=Q0F0T0_9PROT|nr:DUF523 domain-containing protein [Mariprofundus ferrooxydans]EAU55461.1 hypothetical protein SPV1_12031 [Mariprofundus ferrooxydans PV-1]KON47630.1 purine nucleoside phosphorylase [Mariprofundus ferrooxydans]